MVGYHDSSYVGQDRPALRYAGKVGTGFDQRALTAVRHRCDELGTDRCPFDDQAREGGAHWLRPELVAQVGFTERTRAHRLHHLRLGLRDDKPAADPTREEATRRRAGRPSS